MRCKNEKGRVFPRDRAWLPIAGLFGLLDLLVMLNEVLDLPHLLLKAPSTFVNWVEVGIEMTAISVIGIVVVLWRIYLEELVEERTFFDDLTGLFNRRGFSTLAGRQLKVAKRAGTKMVLLFADFDGLKQVNDTFGHPEGDRALIAVAGVLKKTFRESDIIARISGDEFVVLMVETTDFDININAFLIRLRENLEAHDAKNIRGYTLSLSVGVAHYDPKDPCSLDDLLAQADRAMYEQKQHNNKGGDS